MDPEKIDENFSEAIKRPLSFAKSVKGCINENDNIVEQTRWSVILGNETPKSFSGSFKDVRLWKSARTDADLYSNRFTQIEYDVDLAGNLKFMDGNPFIFNSAIKNNFGNEYANIEPKMLMDKPD